MLTSLSLHPLEAVNPFASSLTEPSPTISLTISLASFLNLPPLHLAAWILNLHPELQEFVVLTSFINDIMQCGDPVGDPPGHAELMRTARAVFPYYKIGKCEFIDYKTSLPTF